MKKKMTLVTASAGSGKTHKLQETLAKFVDPKNPEKIRPEAVIATSFTKKAALELKERARKALIDKGYFDEAVRLEGALISTVHSVCTKLIEMFSYDSGLSPKIEVLPEDDQVIYFNLALSNALPLEMTRKLESLSFKIVGTDRYGDRPDWRSEISRIVNEARSNGIGEDGLKRSFEHSWETVKKTLPTTIDGEAFEKQILTEGKRIKAEFEALPKRAGADQNFYDRLKDFLAKLENKWDLPWDSWQALDCELNVPGKKIATSFIGSVLGFTAHPKFQDDYRDYQKTIFEAATLALKAYQEFKKERGLVDYVDMECMVLELLEHKSVQDRVAQEFDLLMVDEFQDTNPIQLGIFLKLSKLIPNVIWVGDQKQSIYAFRGADPSLMAGLLEKLKSDMNIETLENSYRSRPHLVEHTNALFTKAFKGLLPEEQIKLTAKRSERKEFSDAIEVWRVERSQVRSKNERILKAIAQQIKDILVEKRMVAQKVSKDEEIIREMTFKDIAVLCRYNGACTEIARALKEIGLPVSLEQPGLLQLPESKLLMAALRYFSFPQDSLSIMEMKLLSEGGNVEDLIDERLKVVHEKTYGEYGKDHWMVSRIDKLRELALSLSPVEVVEHLLIQLELERVVNAWDGAEDRFSNLLLFKNYASQYEESCHRLKVGATLGGFILWLQDRESNDMLCYGGSQGEDAITVMTWHKSKGLEWPMVVLNDCGNEIRKSAFGLKVVALSKELDLDNPLKDRVLRFWFNPFQSARTGVTFIDKLNASTEAIASEDDCIKEGKRLLYVGITRARDYLCIPLDVKTPARLFAEVLDSDVDLPEKAGKVALMWAEECAPVLVKSFMDVDKALVVEGGETHALVPKALKGPEVFELYLINPSKQEPIPGATATLFGTYGKRLTVKGKVDDDKLGDCLHDIAALAHLSKADVERVLRNYKMDTVLDADEIVKQMELFEAFMEEKGFKNSLREIPIGNLSANFQLINGAIDNIWRSETNELLVVDHKSFRGIDLEKKSCEYSGQLHVYTKSVGAKAMINYISQGVIFLINAPT